MGHRLWTVKPVKPEALAVVERSRIGGNLPPIVQRLVAQRHLPYEEAVDHFLSPRLDDLSDPFLLPHMRQAVDRVLQAIDNKESIVLYGDYDVDGVTSLTILTQVMRAFGLQPRPFLPHRMDEGYGLSREGLARCLADGKPNLLIAVDCGTSSPGEVDWLHTQGIDVIILDHHELPLSGAPKCCALVNPKCGDTGHYFCTAGLAWKFGHALLKARRIGFDLRTLLELAALGTVADVVPLVEENRLLVHRGLQRLMVTHHPGLQALKAVSGIKTQPKAGDIGFRLGPRLNASGRLANAQASLDLLLSEDLDTATPLAQMLEAHNTARRSVQQRIEREALDLVTNDPALLSRTGLAVGADNWHAGVVGIVAAKLMRKHLRPVFVVAFDEEGMGKGSGRSVEGISLVQAINECRDLLVKGGGHDMAAGISIARENFSQFQLRFDAAVRKQAGPEGLSPRLWLDAEVPLEELNWDFIDAYEHLEPFGMDNPMPLFLLRGVTPARPVQVVKEKHRRLILRQGSVETPAMWFDSADDPLPPAPWDVAINIERGNYRGNETLNVVVSALRSSMPS